MVALVVERIGAVEVGDGQRVDVGLAASISLVQPSMKNSGVLLSQTTMGSATAGAARATRPSTARASGVTRMKSVPLT